MVSYRKITTAFTQEYTYSYKDNAARDLNSITLNESLTFKPLKDVNGRNTGKEISSKDGKIAGEYISYRKIGDHATVTPSAVWFASGDEIKDNLRYKYDNSGNIIEVHENGKLAVRYEYDALNRLIKEDNKPLNKITEVVYDDNGNILYKHITHDGETITDTYLYDGDKLLSFNGEKCEYNNLGSPTVYRGKNLKWLYGKMLEEFEGNKFIYDSRGNRIAKNNDWQIYGFDGKILGTFNPDENGLQFIYDDKGTTGFIHKKSTYFYRKDIQGNIIAILDDTGAVVVKYVYDAWGNHAVLDADGNDIEDAEHIGNLNPFRYRGYYFDVETGLYYLQTRYYDPETGRFISQDSLEYADPETINGLNLYAYCGNNPIMNIDPSGEFFFSLFVGAIIAGLIAGAFSATFTALQGGSALDCLGAFAGGFITGAVLGAASILGGGLVVGALSATVGHIIGVAAFLTVGTFAAGIGAYWVEHKINGTEFHWDEALTSGALTFVQGLLSFGVGAALGAGGFYDYLKPGNGLMDYTNLFKQGFGKKGYFMGATAYFMENLWPTVVRSGIKSFFTFPWNLIKP